MNRLAALLVMLVACSGSAQPAANPAAAGTGRISGTPTGTPFTAVKAAFWIGSPDSPDTTVVYVFSSAVACSDLEMPGWDSRIQDRTQVLEMKLLGTIAPATFSVAATHTPAPGEASVNYTESSSRMPVETLASGGTVSLETLVANARATGTFALSYTNGGSLTGSFDAIFCPGGHEP